MKQVTLILTGGFLGAGKTTLLGAVTRKLTSAGKRVGLITNDQAEGLVDTALLQKETLAIAEVSGGCFCCRFDDLMSAAERLLEKMAPDVLLGEPVGSCTDLSATVLQPIKDLYGDSFHVAPFSVLADPARLVEALDSGTDSGFPGSVNYIFCKQLEEADIILLNKADVCTREEITACLDLLKQHVPGVPVRVISALKDQGIDEWLETVLTGAQTGGQRLAEVDYDVYAEGEAVLGWMNATVALCSANAGDTPPDWQSFCASFLEEMRDRLGAQSAEIAHLKVLFSGGSGALVANVTHSGTAPVFRGDAPQGDREVTAVVNARVHLAPEDLRAVLEQSLQSVAPAAGLGFEIQHIQSFRPGRPEPKHRFTKTVSPRANA